MEPQLNKINVKSGIVQDVHDPLHCENTLEKFRQEQAADVVLVTEYGSKRTSAHRSILSAASDFFSAMFRSNMKETHETEVPMEEVNGEILEELIEYCYTGRLSITSDNILDLLAVASMLRFEKILQECEVFLKSVLLESPADCLIVHTAAKEYAMTDLVDKSVSIIVDTFESTASNDDFLKISYELLKLILEKTDQIPLKQEDIFKAAMRWVNHDQGNREQFIREILRHIKLEEMSVSFLSEGIYKTCSSSNCHELVVNALVAKLQLLVDLKAADSDLLFVCAPYPQRDDGSRCTFDIMRYHSATGQLTSFMKDIPLNFTTSKIQLLNKHLYFIGSANVKLDPKIATRTQIAQMNTERSVFAFATLNGLLYVAGGVEKKGSTCSSSVECYNPYIDNWTPVQNLPTPRISASAVAVNNRLYVLGGQRSGLAISSCECYDPATDQWTNKADMIEPAESPFACVLKNQIYVVGNGIADPNVISVQIYDPESDKWTKVSTTTSHTGNEIKAVTVLDDHILMVNKTQNPSIANVNILEKLILTENKWIEVKKLSPNSTYLYAIPVLKKLL